VNGLAQNLETRAENRGEHATVELGGDVDVAGAALGDSRARRDTPERVAANKQLFAEIRFRVEGRFGRAGARVLELVLESREERAAALGMSIEEADRLKRNVINYCQKLRAELGVDRGGFERARKSQELLALEREIEAMLPWHVRWRGFIHLIVVLIVVAAALIARKMLLAGH
jgi:hypothetical protein